jgi:mono/diheme cytochrome c family protein
MKRTMAVAVIMAAFFSTSAFALDAEALYKSRCQPCHGPGGKGTGIAPALVNNRFIQSATDQDIANSIVKGRQGADRKYPDKYPAGMPPQKLSDAEAQSMIAYLKSLQGK